MPDDNIKRIPISALRQEEGAHEFCMFLKALLGAEAMEGLMTNAVRVAKQTE